MKNKKIRTWIFIGLILIAGIFIFSANLKNSGNQQSRSSVGANGEFPVWMNTELKDVRTGETFRISDFEGKPILLESFAVWCPTCTKQQNEVKKLHDEIGDSVVSIAINTDPNEDESKVLEHIQKNNFNWYYAISPIDMTQSLISEFGNSIINAPSTPMVLICEDGSYRKLGSSGVRDTAELKEEIERGC